MSVTEFNTPQPEHVEMAISGDTGALNEYKKNSSDNVSFLEKSKNPMALLLSSLSHNNSSDKLVGSSPSSSAVSGTDETGSNDMYHKSPSVPLSRDNARIEQRSASDSGINSSIVLHDSVRENTQREYKKDSNMPSPPLSPHNAEALLMLTPPESNTYTTQNILEKLPHEPAEFLLDNCFDSIFSNENVHPELSLKVNANKPLVVDLQWSARDYKTEFKEYIAKYRNFNALKHAKRVSRYNSKTNGSNAASGTRRYATRSRAAYPPSSSSSFTNIVNGLGADAGSGSPVRTYRTRQRTSKENGNNTDYPFRPAQTTHSASTTVHKPHASHHANHHVVSDEWKSLVDYSPPLSTLAAANRSSMKVEWKGSTMDLSADPLRSHLHPAELALASILRLTCDSYLESKRRLFIEKVAKLKKGLSFRRTDAQKACRIDVNKASRLYQAFEKVGWLDDKYFQKYL